MQDFATAKLSPWAIALLVKENDWSHLEKVIHYNCTLLGGFHNVLIPVLEDCELRPRFEMFLYLYDPDFIVLPPQMTEPPKKLRELPITPFGIVQWNQVPQIFPDNAWSSSSTWATNVRPFHRSKFEHDLGPRDLVAVSDPHLPDASRLALFACGDVLPAKEDWDEFDGDVYLNAHGARGSQ